jgi:hypothetical protein
MLATKVVCPHCAKQLKTSKPLAVGHRVLCSGCGQSFAVPGAGGNGNAVQAVRPVAALPHPPTLQPSPRLDPPHVQPVQPAGNRHMVWIGIILGGLGFLMCLTVVVVLILVLRKGPAPSDTTPLVEAERPKEAPANSPLLPEGNGRDDASSRLAPEAEPVPALPPEEQEKVRTAIERGVQWLKRHQTAQGGWGPQHPVGLTALPALTLLECGVPADDSHVQKAVQNLRRLLPQLNRTYELALAILFLDRLGDPADEKWIQTCALRLVAGQTPAGGWTYNCPLLNSQQEQDLLTIMQQTRPTSALDLFVADPDGSAPPGFLPGKDLRVGSSLDAKLLPVGDAPPDSEAYQKALTRLPPQLKGVPALQPPAKAQKLPPHDGSDNSNTQFAILGLSAAHKHNLPLERALALIAQRFHKSQLANGRWNYPYSSPPHPNQQWSPAMTGAGLLGLAVGLGLAADHAQRPNTPGRFQDPAIEKGFDFLGQFIGKPIGTNKPRNRNREPINLYFLWTVERCGVLYGRREIGGKDWYQWGAELLVDHQNPDGFWALGGYYGSMPVLDTSFALLFLQRANLAKDLTKKLEFFMDGKKLQGP